VPSGSHGFLPSAAGAETNVLRYFSPAKVLFVAILVTATWMLLKWVRGFLDRLEKHNPRLRFMLRQVEPSLRMPSGSAQSCYRRRFSPLRRTPFSRPWDRLPSLLV
jgi:hypothetical protein